MNLASQAARASEKCPHQSLTLTTGHRPRAFGSGCVTGGLKRHSPASSWAGALLAMCSSKKVQELQAVLLVMIWSYRCLRKVDCRCQTLE